MSIYINAAHTQGYVNLVNYTLFVTLSYMQEIPVPKVRYVLASFLKRKRKKEGKYDLNLKLC